ncbi:MAG: hypothetical protein UW68_C0015G0017 [Candidatus Collierbacteria bacterium GW2011_GWB1_44_6]|uniref:Uncharacterized protein n=2 Tax=Candidatus Collieribacteriota TaxID=1752725 RepID=A0A0G1MMH1_9BACT|nr:MAG: hypothetical protein UV68_C0038G0008 [Candidatus Collierbacteria bacterium GW2011_GWC2_43_12]KKT73189.1 MAG: hypothetical protein UW68_C0015G0017 [Candidatus Collierbacteria bacterium GW2011_GWB1_44_6]KKT83702.1 MAG: hypothetical protein UW80_C0008G0010 [Microgenomates group bacterium GW2011_GWC1_44_9]
MDIEFEFEGKKYKVSNLARYSKKIVLPDKRVLKAKNWDAMDPQSKPEGLYDTKSLFSTLPSLTAKEVAVAEGKIYVAEIVL